VGKLEDEQAQKPVFWKGDSGKSGKTSFGEVRKQRGMADGPIRERLVSE